jgi:uncharacterized protein (TIRG00374 family)
LPYKILYNAARANQSSALRVENFLRFSISEHSILRRYLKFFALALVAAVIIWFFGRNVNWAEVRAAVERADKSLIFAACVTIFGSYAARAFRWRVLLQPIVSARWGALFAATTIGFGSIFLAGRPGEVVRPAVLPLIDKRVNPGASFVTIAVERIFDMTAVVFIFALNMLLFRPASSVTDEQLTAYGRVRFAGFLLLATAAAGIFTLVLFRFYSSPIVGWFERRFAQSDSLVARSGRIIGGLLEQLARALGVLTNWRALAQVIGWTIALWTFVTLSQNFVLRAFGLPSRFRETIFVMGWSLVGSLVPTPGGAAGAFHAATAAGMIFLGVGRDQAAAASIVLHLVMFGVAILPGFYYFVRGDFQLEQIKKILREEPHREPPLTNLTGEQAQAE